MLKLVLRLLVLILTLTNLSLFPVQLAGVGFQPGGLTSGMVPDLWAAASLNVKKFGALGDGVHNDSAAISAAIGAARDGDVVYFPAGIYICNDVEAANKNNLTLKGQGDATIIRNGIFNGTNPILTFSAVTGLTIQDLAFDNRSIGSFGGVRFYDTANVLINRTHFFDSAPLALGSSDRYAYVFGNGTRQHENIRITNNLIEDLQLEVDLGYQVVIQKNTLKRSVRTGAIGLFTVDDGVVLENYLIDSNTIIDPVGAAIAVNIDPPDNINIAYKNISITNNTIVFNRMPTEAIHVGPADSAMGAAGNVYDGIVIQKNLIQVAKGAVAQPGDSALINFNAGSNSALNFKNTTVAQNQIQGGDDTALGVVAMNLRFLENSAVNANTVSNMFTVMVFNQLLNTSIEQNYVAQINDYPAYLFDNSRGGNLFQNNYYSGPVTTPLSYENGNTTDIIVKPTLWTKRLASGKR